MFNMDMVLTLVGILLVIIGVVVFLFGRRRTEKGDSNRHIFEAFGIKLDVSNPSILLIMFGVVLMLAPRFVPVGGEQMHADGVVIEDGGQAVDEHRQKEEQRHEQQMVGEERLRLEEARRAREQEVADRERAAREQAERERAGQEKAERQRLEQQLAEERRRADRLAAEQRVAVIHEVAAAVSIASPAPPPQLEPAPLRVVVVTGVKRPIGDVAAVVYRDKAKRALDAVARELLGDGAEFSGANPSLRSELRNRSLTEFCRRWQVDRVLYAEVEPPVVEIGIESGNWPEASFAIGNCNNGEFRESKPAGLSPTGGDAFPFQLALERRARTFFETNRGMLDH